MKCQHTYQNKGGCGKSAKFHLQKPGRVKDVCSMHLSSAVRELCKGSKQGYVEVETIGKGL